MPNKLSAASQRALHYTKGPEWFCDIVTKPITGDLAIHEPGMERFEVSERLKDYFLNKDTYE